ncbi:hypothetical protein H3302_16065 [Pseudoalteromonas sp. MT33b]|nr:hypothetical protein [Pseudoalteromonas sp. MT33b]QMW14544.1 hypothetical protein H3302_16065 [Pseudoalteromonas sp. MT33b]
MKLYQEELDVSEQLAEFDQWLTAKLERIKDSEKFNLEINSLCDCIQSIAPYLDNFSVRSGCNIENLCSAVLSASSLLIKGVSFFDDERVVADFYNSFFNLLFLTSGATDNNLKNHFLIKLKEDEIQPYIPKRGPSKKNIKFKLDKVPSTTKSDYIAKSLASCFVASQAQYREHVKTEPFFDPSFYLNLLLKEYISLILEDEDETIQFWAVCSSFISLNNSSESMNLGRYLLNSCTIFKVRGSVSASGGHITEDILRDKLLTIGMQPESDFNTNDVTIGEQEIVENGKRRKKTRAYDFILPYNIENWEPKPKLFIQSQFYAGDSGSVSHKVVDQTQSSRAFTLSKYRNARFVEYLDGAGYYAALRGDLAHMLSFEDTASFFQVKSILIRLRRELQEIKYLTPIELEHSILTSDDGDLSKIKTSLELDGYPNEEIERVITLSLNLNFINQSCNTLQVSEDRISISRRLLILDIAANNASQITEQERHSQKYLLLPGYGPNFGILESKLTELACLACKQIQISAPSFASDVEWLLDEGVFKRR